jgi:hypothetical protein
MVDVFNGRRLNRQIGEYESGQSTRWTSWTADGAEQVRRRERLKGIELRLKAAKELRVFASIKRKRAREREKEREGRAGKSNEGDKCRRQR